MTLEEALHLYLQRVSVNKKGYVQEKYRINSISRYEIASKALNEIESYDIAYYRDLRLSSTNRVTGKTISPTTVRAELESPLIYQTLLSHFIMVKNEVLNEQ